MIEEYIRFHIKGLNYVIKKIILRFDGYLFCSLANFYFIFKGMSTRFCCNESMYSVKEPGETRFFKNKVQALNVYSSGLKNRNRNLNEVYFLDLIDFSENDLIVDCGANVGDIFFCIAGRQEKKLRYIGFEPAPAEYDALAKNVGFMNSLNMGLWHERSHLDFYVASDGADSSLIEPPKYTHKITVETNRLDNIVKEKIKLFKLEAEGAEPEVLMGATGILPSIEYISADLGFERGIYSESTLVPVINFLEKHGFELKAISHGRICALFKNKNIN
jgi:FkbM family methyltransferase